MKRRSFALVVFAALVLAGFAYLLWPKKSLIAYDLARDGARFTPEESVDLAFATGQMTHSPPHIEHPYGPVPPQLLYPPTPEDLERLSGE